MSPKKGEISPLDSIVISVVVLRNDLQASTSVYSYFRLEAISALTEVNNCCQFASNQYHAPSVGLWDSESRTEIWRLFQTSVFPTMIWN